MKRKILVIMLMLICITAISKESLAKEYSSVIDDNLGRTLDLVGGSVSQGSFKTDLVFDFDKLQNNVVEKKISIGRGDSVKYSGSSIQKLVDEYSDNFSVSGSLTFSGIGSLNFKNKLYNSNSASDFVSRNYYFENTSFSSYQTYFENPAEDYGTNYSDSISNGFKAAVNTAHNSSSSEKNKKYIELFKKYGTHILVKATYGASVQSYASMLSNNINTTQISQNDINSGFNLLISNNVFSTNIEDSSISTKVTALEKTKSFFSMSFNGFNEANYYSYRNNKENWILSANIEENTTFIDSKENQYVPIWNYLKWSSASNAIKNEMETAYNAYNDENQLNDTIYSNESVVGRSETYKIHDSGKWSSKNNPEKFDFGYSTDEESIIMEYIKNPDKYMVSVNVEYTSKHKEIDSGYQYLYIYSNENKKSAIQLWASGDLPNSKKKEWTTCVYNFEIDSTKLDGLYFVLLNDASGTGWDDWYLGEISLRITLNIEFLG